MRKKSKPPEIWECLPITRERAKEFVNALCDHEEPERAIALIGLLCGLYVESMPERGCPGNDDIAHNAMFHAFSFTQEFNDSFFSLVVSRGFARDYRKRRRAEEGGTK